MNKFDCTYICTLGVPNNPARLGSLGSQKTDVYKYIFYLYIKSTVYW
jgi:hypothetical protein